MSPASTVQRARWNSALLAARRRLAPHGVGLREFMDDFEADCFDDEFRDLWHQVRGVLDAVAADDEERAAGAGSSALSSPSIGRLEMA